MVDPSVDHMLALRQFDRTIFRQAERAFTLIAH
jgi:hypothetical protein